MKALTAARQRLVLHWGEMGDRWGVNRTVAQVHALLYLAAEPVTAEEIATTLAVARSNVSNSLRELQGWGLVRVVHQFGDRRQHFEALSDVWEMFRVIVEQRKQREIDPTLAVLRTCLDELRESDRDSSELRHRLDELLDFFLAIDALYSDARKLPVPVLKRVLKTRGLLRKVLPNM